jgi:predicted RNase H-like HicB family nuclease
MARELPPEERYEIDISWSDEDDAFVALIPDMPYAGGHGETMEEALAMAKEAIRSYVEIAQETGEPIPQPKSRQTA